MTPDEFERSVGDILRTVPVMTLATCGGEAPWATDVYGAPLGWRLVFFSSPGSRHCRNLAIRPACSVTVHPEVASWRDIRGVQMEGTVQPASAVLEPAAATHAYVAKFPFVAGLLAGGGEAAGKMARVSPHVFTPTRIRYLDNTLGFGVRFLVRLEAGRPIGPPEREDAA